MLRILHVVANLNRAGTETMLMNYFRNIDRDLVQFDFAICSENKCDYEDEVISMGGRIFRYPKYTVLNHISYIKWWNDFFADHPEYPIIHGHIGSTAAIYLSIAKKHKRYTIAHSHGTYGPLNLRSVAYRVYSYRTRYIADMFFGCSRNAIEDRYGKRVASNKAKSRVINNAIDSKQFVYSETIRGEVRKEFDLCSDSFVIGTIGRLATQKNPFKTIEIIKELKKTCHSFYFMWVGTGPLEKEIQAAIRESGLEDQVIMTGLRDDIPRLLQAFDVFILPSVWEGLGIVAVEAQASGLPTICSDTVPTEAKVTDYCSFLPLDDVNKWVRSIMESKSYMRMDTSLSIIDAGYDIKAASKWLQCFYLEHVR